MDVWIAMSLWLDDRCAVSPMNTFIRIEQRKKREKKNSKKNKKATAKSYVVNITGEWKIECGLENDLLHGGTSKSDPFESKSR